MKKKLALLILLFSFLNCTKEEKIIDDSYLFDQDEDCIENDKGTCCDVDGRILVEPDSYYTYTYKGISNLNSSTQNITWSAVGSISIVSGQGTSQASFKFNSDFTSGQISAIGKVGECCDCQNTIIITKI